jgi:phosphotriesterase-related protein
MGTGYYMAKTHPPEMEDWTEQQIATEFVNEIMIGAEGTGVRVGIIGEIGCSWPMAKNELKVLRAGAMAQQETGAPLMIHPGPDENAPLEIIEILRNAGADLSRTIICHMPRTLFDLTNRLKLAEAGCYLEWDLFGEDSYYHAGFGFSRILPNEPQQIDHIGELIARGYEKQILISHDICLKMRLTRYGGNGYGYILRYGVLLTRWYYGLFFRCCSGKW